VHQEDPLLWSVLKLSLTFHVTPNAGGWAEAVACHWTGYEFVQRHLLDAYLPMRFQAHYQMALSFQIHVPSTPEHSSESWHVPGVYPVGLDPSSALEETRNFTTKVHYVTFMNQIYSCVGLKLHVNYSGTVAMWQPRWWKQTYTYYPIPLQLPHFFKLWAHSFNTFFPVHSVCCIKSVIPTTYNTISLFILQI
jgi:hypothetical protein